jgi:hypothetical protein
MPMQTYWGGGSTARTYSQPGTGRRWVVRGTLQPLYHEKHPVPIVQKAGWVLASVWIAPKISPPAGFDLLTVQPVENGYND